MRDRNSNRGGAHEWRAFVVMPNFETRWRLGLDRIRNKPLEDQKYTANAGKVVHMMSLVHAFRNSTFIYGTTGPNAFHSGGIGSHPAIRAIHVMNTRVKKYGEDHGVPAEKAARVLQRLFFNIRLKKSVYDPGPRAKQYLQNEYQMMDMYYGMHGIEGNKFWMKRDNTIAEFVHYVMGYHMEGVDFRPDEPGWKAYKTAFPGAGPGWLLSEEARLRYGQSATKEISKIIREGIKTFGGTLIFEGKDVYGDSVFNSQATPRDTDVEARDLFTYFGRARLSAQVPFGNGRLEYHWGGRPTIPTRAHFLSNWRYAPAPQKKGVAPTHTKANREGKDEYLDNWIAFLGLAMQKNPAGFLPIWSNFENFPRDRPSAQGVQGMMEAIDHLCRHP